MKVPINPLLYLVSLACAGGIVLNIMGTMKPRFRWDPKEVELRNQVKTLMERGGKVLPDIGQWRYDVINPFWEQFRSANFTGYRPPVVEVKKDIKKDDTAAGASDVDLNEKIVVVCISYGGDEGDNTYTRAVVKYRDPQVEVPENLRPSAAGPGDVARPTVPSRGGRRPPTPVIPQMTSTVPLDHVELGTPLWKPYQNFYLVEVAEDARSVFFENRAKEKVDGKYPRQELIKNELGLPEDVAKMLVEESRRTRPATPNQKTALGPKKPASQWQDLPETKAIRENEWNVSRKDLDYINQRGNKFIHEDVGLGDYSGGSGKHKVQGVSVNKLGHRARGLGISEGDILISVNGIKVKNRAHAIREGKRLWRKGVRTFKAVFLRRGQEITITHHFPDK
jgi:hypothetical protein